MLRPKGITPMKLPFVSLIIAVYDRDQVGHDDLLGCAIVPLAPPGYTPSIKSGNLPEEYEVPFETKLVHGMKTNGTPPQAKPTHSQTAALQLCSTLTTTLTRFPHLPLTRALVTGVGDIKGTITVSYASMLEGALKKAAADKAGECARTLSHYNTFFNCLYACYDLGS